MKQIYKSFIFIFILLLFFEGLKFIYFTTAYISELVTPQFYMNTAIDVYMNFKTSIDSVLRQGIPFFALCLGIFTGIVYIIVKDDLNLNVFRLAKIRGSKYIRFLIYWIFSISILQAINYGLINVYQMNRDYLFMLQISEQGINSFHILTISGIILFMTTYLLIVYSAYMLYIIIVIFINQSKIKERINEKNT